MILLRVSIAFLALLLLPDIYIYKVYIKNKHDKWMSRLHWTPSVLLLLALVAFLSAYQALEEWFGLYLVTTLCIAVPKATFVVSDLALKGIRKLCRWPKLEWIPSLLLALSCFGYLLFGAVKGKENFQVRQVTFASPDLPSAFDGYRILQISDLHTGSWKGNSQALQKAIDICNAQKANLAVFTGDMVNSRANELTEFMPVLSRLHAPDGVYSITGNHDYGTYAQWETEANRLANLDTLLMRERQMGWRTLMNEHVFLSRGNDSIVLAGVENTGLPPFPDEGDLTKALAGTKEKFKILLSHDPTHWRREVLPQSDVQLMLAGHTHDMQISLFGFSASRFIYPEHNGLYLENERGLYVNIGLGFVLFPMRLGAWPEITVITLRKKQ